MAIETKCKSLHRGILAVALLVGMSGCSSPELPANAQTALRNGTTFELFSLDPAEEKAIVQGTYEGEQFHRWAILGSTMIEDTATRETLLDALDEGIAEKDPNVVVNCFWPRHGIRVMHDGKQHDFLICFQCESGVWYVDGEESGGVASTELPKSMFNQVLQDAGVPLVRRSPPTGRCESPGARCARPPAPEHPFKKRSSWQNNRALQAVTEHFSWQLGRFRAIIPLGGKLLLLGCQGRAITNEQPDAASYVLRRGVFMRSLVARVNRCPENRVGVN